MTKTTFSLLFFQTGYNVSRWIQSLYTVLNLRFQKTKQKVHTSCKANAQTLMLMNRKCKQQHNTHNTQMKEILSIAMNKENRARAISHAHLCV